MESGGRDGESLPSVDVAQSGNDRASEHDSDEVEGAKVPELFLGSAFQIVLLDPVIQGLLGGGVNSMTVLLVLFKSTVSVFLPFSS